MNRRDFIRASTSGLAAATIPAAGSGRAADNIVREAQLGSLRSASPSDLQGLVGDGRQRRILLRGGVVLSLDPRVGDFEKADVLIDGKRIAEVAPTVSAGDAEIVDCTGTIVMPGSSTRTITGTRRSNAA
jgi:5-methylthioadenosine/S-adenosylhomocysteine deaminase